MKNIVITILSSILTLVLGFVSGFLISVASVVTCNEVYGKCMIETVGSCPHDCKTCKNGPTEEDILI